MSRFEKNYKAERSVSHKLLPPGMQIHSHLSMLFRHATQSLDSIKKLVMSILDL
jgi:hypothetical protein